jgi:hypothetical protein
MTTPTGKLAWGQAGNYDAADDRAVITAVTNGRVGLVAPVQVNAGAGLLILIRGGWVGVASCADQTSAVVGSREDSVVTANPGPATGSREDVIWCDTNPDEGVWEMRVLTAAQAAGRAGIPLVNITVPANANLSSQMDIRSVDASIERRLLSHRGMPGGNFNDYNATTWAAAVGRGVESDPCWIETGEWYRISYHCTCPSLVGGTRPPLGTQLEGIIGIGERPQGQAAPLSQLRRGGVFGWAYYTVPMVLHQEYVFRHAITAAPLWRIFDGRIWKHPSTPGSIRPGGYSDLGPEVQWIDVEKIGS